MPSLGEFRAQMEINADQAMRDYVLLVDCKSLDYATSPEGALIQDNFKTVEVVFDFAIVNGLNVITMRAKKASDPKGRPISYLPWKNAASGAMAKATLDEAGPAYFSTSQLDGCRFTIQYHDASHKTVTVQHLAGDYGGSGTDGSAQRDVLEAQHMPAAADPTLRRRLSFGPGQGKTGQRAGPIYRAGRQDTVYYDGGKSSLFAYRNNKGAWVFYAQDIDSRNGRGLGLKNLFTKQAVTGPINANAQA